MDTVQARFRALIELREMMIAMRRQCLLREYPEDSPEQIDARLAAWVVSSDDPTDESPGPRP